MLNVESRCCAKVFIAKIDEQPSNASKIFFIIARVLVLGFEGKTAFYRKGLFGMALFFD